MAVAQVVDTRINPNNPAQRVVLWGNGRIDVTGGPAVVGQRTWYHRPDQPIVVAIHVVDWTTMASYMLDNQGGFHPCNGAPAIGATDPDKGLGEPYIVNGVPYMPARWYVDWAWDPDTPGRGIALDAFGNLHPFGGATAPPRVGRRWAAPVARKLAMRWTPDVRAYTLDYSGGIHPDFAATAAGALGWYWPGVDMAVDFAVTDWSTGSGYVLDRNAGVWAFGSAVGVWSRNYKFGADRARTLEVLNPADPLRLWEVWAGGQEIEWAASSPPTVIAGGFEPLSPATSVTGTTRPVLAWAYSDPQEDSQAQVRVLVFTQAFVNGNSMTDPAVYAASAVVDVTSVDPMLRGIASPVDLPNDAYRMYVRAQDTAGQWSPWSNRAWTQNVTPPAAPTGLTATANNDATVTLSATADPAGAELVRFERSDDGGLTWAPVDGADAVPIAATVTAVDRFPPQGNARTYRAVAYSIDPRTASAPSDTVTVTVPVVGHLLHAADDATLGGRIKVQAVDWRRASSAGVFDGLDADYPTVVKDGSRPRAARATLELMTMDAAAWRQFEELALSRSTLVHRDPFGAVRYCELVGEWGQAQVRAAPMRSEATPLRHLHTTSPQLVEVRPPHLPA